MSSDWFQSWQSAAHDDYLSSLNRWQLARVYKRRESVELLDQYLDHRGVRTTLLEVGCATAEFSRYLARRHPAVTYHGADISRLAIIRAHEKFPKLRDRLWVVEPEKPLTQQIAAAGEAMMYQAVYAQDVVMHQAEPLIFIDELLKVACQCLVFTCRTRDCGETEWDPEKSCQWSWNVGWVPYIVINFAQLIGYLKDRLGEGEIAAWRKYQVLGGNNKRYLPKDCYLTETGMACTTIRVMKSGTYPIWVTVRDVLE